MKAEVNGRLLQAAESGDIAALERALAAGADVNCTTSDGWSALLAVAVHGADAVRLLLTHGADPNLASEMGYTPLMRAAGKGLDDVVELLIEHGADLRARDEGGQTARDMAEHEGEFEIEELLASTLARQIVEKPSPPGTRRVPLSPVNRALIQMTRRTVGGVVRRLDLTFADGTKLPRATVIEELVLELPVALASREIQSASVPFDQG